MRDASQILIRPILTEKSVAPDDAAQVHLRGARRREQGGDPAGGRGALPGDQSRRRQHHDVRGKLRRMGGYRRRSRRGEGHTSEWKKAVVTLRTGTIAAFEGL